MNPELNITVTHTKVHKDVALPIEAIAGGIRPGCSTGAPEYAGDLFPAQAGLP
jgi:hypothetical protein